MILARYDYEPFGALLTPAKGRLGYIGKERDRESSLADHGVRKYDAETGRFTAMEPLLEQYYFWTPYHYCRNNPVSRNDGNGFHDGSMGMIIVANDMANLKIQENPVAVETFKTGLIVAGGVAGVVSSGLAIGAGYSLAMGAVSGLEYLGGAGLMVSGLYGVIATPIRTVGELTDNEDLKSVPATYTGMGGRGIDAAVGDGTNRYEMYGNVIQNVVTAGYGVYTNSSILAKTIDVEQIGESVVEASKQPTTKDSKKKSKKSKTTAVQTPYADTVNVSNNQDCQVTGSFIN